MLRCLACHPQLNENLFENSSTTADGKKTTLQSVLLEVHSKVKSVNAKNGVGTRGTSKKLDTIIQFAVNEVNRAFLTKPPLEKRFDVSSHVALDDPKLDVLNETTATEAKSKEMPEEKKKADTGVDEDGWQTCPLCSVRFTYFIYLHLHLL